jgi:hypothetical protein
MEHEGSLPCSQKTAKKSDVLLTFGNFFVAEWLSATLSNPQALWPRLLAVPDDLFHTFLATPHIWRQSSLSTLVTKNPLRPWTFKCYQRSNISKFREGVKPAHKVNI